MAERNEMTRSMAFPAWKRAVVILGLTLLAAGPPFLSSYWVGLLTQMLIFAVLAMSLDVLLGYTGLPSLGHVGFSALRPIRSRFWPQPIRRVSGSVLRAAS